MQIIKPVNPEILAIWAQKMATATGITVRRAPLTATTL
ncbi:hypothetical protein N0824_02242 [Microcystis sp. 0824]|nr:hypothetical protein N0824_02242 [Microcystis sp. 0824]